MPISFPALALVVFLVANSLLSQRSGAIQVEQLQWRCIESLVVWALLLGSLLIVPGVSLKAYGFRFQGVLKQLGLGILAFMASFLPVYLLLLATSPLRTAEGLHPFLVFLQTHHGPVAVLWIGLSVSIVAPLLEELIYRVILQTALARWLPAVAAIPLTAVLFCLVHGWPDMIPLLPLALVLGYVYHRYNSYLAVVAAHSLFNTWMLGWAILVPATG
jgi:membrane protease YdiL (CAAX protease family)